MKAIDNKHLENLRQDYTLFSLSQKTAEQEPFSQFAKWFNEAVALKIVEPNAFTLSTLSKDGQPSSRVMLLKGFNDQGFTFFTNYLSRKAEDIEYNNKVCLSFFWLGIQRQIIIKGTAQKTTREESVEYFQSRPKASQIGAWVSKQSSLIESREELESRKTELEQQYENTDRLPCPDYWGGYLVRPTEIEFWQGGSGRIHDRLLYQKQPDSTWEISRLAP